jgi:hypothetical protein
MKTKILFSMLAVATISFTSCDDDEKPKTLPVVSTAAMADVTTTTAMGGGEVTDDGNAAITVMGLAYSTSNATPTIDDEKTEVTVAEGPFTSLLENLASGTTYHVRAYATNSVGTGYGEVVDFTTSNAAPEATGITITGLVQVPEKLTATYTYTDSENDVESESTFQWYIATDGTGTGETAIAGATALTYDIQKADEFKFIRIGITPKSSTGTSSGAEVKSSFVGPVAEEPTTVTFTYNGTQVTYGIIISSVTGRRWLDRNLGAPNAPTARNDFANYGDAFQWGRGADGHQLVTRAATNAATVGVNGTTATLSSSTSPGHNLFITATPTPGDWMTTQNDNLWQGVNGTNNPCPSGWRIPTIAEWQAENIPNVIVGYTQLKLTLGGYRDYSNGTFALTTSFGFYASSTVDGTLVKAINTRSTTFSVSGEARALGTLCRCIKN